jgi:hypothetical protein
MAAADRIDQVPVVIAGAGPAGLVAAVTLARNGVASLLVERHPGLSPLPRATAVSTRTMELLRSWGLEDEVRAGHLPITAVGAWAAETLASAEGAWPRSATPTSGRPPRPARPRWPPCPRTTWSRCCSATWRAWGRPRSASAPSWSPSTRTATASAWSSGRWRRVRCGPSGPATRSAPTAPTRGSGTCSASPWTVPVT